MRITPLLAVVVLASTAVGQMTMPAFGNTFTAGLTRGFWFQAPANGVITGLEVPNEAARPNQVVEVIDFGLAPPPAFPGTVTGTQLFYDNATPSGQIIPTAIILQQGNYYGILGACTDSVGGGTSYNSYGTPAGPFQSDFLGIPTTITRCGTQSGIGANSGNQPMWQEAGGPVARVDVYLSSTGGGTIATNDILGEGCGGNEIGEGTVYETWTAGFDLANTGHTYIWTGDGYVMIDGAGPIVAPTGSPTAFGDDQTQPVSLPFGFACVQGVVNDVYLCSNGWLSFEPTTSADYTESLGEFLGQFGRLAFLWDDLNPGAGGSITVGAVGASEFHITFTGVPEYSNTGANNVQVVLFDSGTIEVRYGACSLQDALVGLTAGNGATDPGPTDISDLVTIGAVIITTGFGPFLDDLSMAASTRPVLGTSWNLTVNNIQPAAVFGVSIWGVSDPAITNLGTLGMPGCQLRAGVDVVAGPWTPVGGSYTYSAAIPGMPVSLIGFELFAQAAVFGGMPNAFDAVTSNGIKGTLGDL